MSLGNKLVSSGKYLAVALTLALGLTVYNNSFAGEHAHPHWTYEGEEGPERWGEISKEYAACSEGKAQSPIDITGAAAEDLPDIDFSYKPTKLNIVNNGHTIQVNYDKGSVIKVNGADYELVQFHFHDPSEHKVEGKSYGMELHLVHKNAQGQLAVVGVLIEEGAKNAAYETIWANLPKKAKEERSVNATVNAGDLLPKDRHYYRYAGSLTTPPCSESVTWLVLKTPVQMSAAQIEAFRGIVERNSRPVQPLNGRKVEADTTSK